VINAERELATSLLVGNRYFTVVEFNVAVGSASLPTPAMRE